jgi:hypothetical protein
MSLGLAWRQQAHAERHAAEPVGYSGINGYVEAWEAANRMSYVERRMVFAARGYLRHYNWCSTTHPVREQRRRDLPVR